VCVWGGWGGCGDGAGTCTNSPVRTRSPRSCGSRRSPGSPARRPCRLSRRPTVFLARSPVTGALGCPRGRWRGASVSMTAGSPDSSRRPTRGPARGQRIAPIPSRSCLLLALTPAWPPGPARCSRPVNAPAARRRGRLLTPCSTAMLPVRDRRSIGDAGALLCRLAERTGDQRGRPRHLLRRSTLAPVLRHETAADIDVQRPFRRTRPRLGYLAELRNRLVAGTGLRLP